MAQQPQAAASIVLTGPESAGKTTLAAALGARLQREVVDEYARDYLQPRGGRYSEDDLSAIAAGQQQRELAARRRGAPVLDTDLTVIVVWSQYRFGRVAADISAALAAAPPRVYLLLEPDLPWEADPLRENPHDRNALLAQYEQLLQQLPWPWRRVGGLGSARLHNALQALGTMGALAAAPGGSAGQHRRS